MSLFISRAMMLMHSTFPTSCVLWDATAQTQLVSRPEQRRNMVNNQNMAMVNLQLKVALDVCQSVHPPRRSVSLAVGWSIDLRIAGPTIRNVSTPSYTDLTLTHMSAFNSGTIKCYFYGAGSKSNTKSPIVTFLVACTRLYTPLCLSVRRSVGLSVRRSETPSSIFGIRLHFGPNRISNHPS